MNPTRKASESEQRQTVTFWEDRLGGLTLPEVPLPEPSCPEILPYLHTAPSDALLLGFANFPTALILASEGLNVTGIDSSTDGIQLYRQIATARGVEMTSHLCDLREFVREGRHQFGLVIAELVLHVLTPCERAAVLESMRRLTRPNGVLFVSALEARDLNFSPRAELPTVEEICHGFSEPEWKIELATIEERGERHVHHNGHVHPHPHAYLRFLARRQ